MTDAHSFARPREARVTHLALTLEVDFERRVLRGAAELDLEVAAGAREVVLDTRALTVAGVRDETGRALDFAVAPADPVLGAALTIQLGEGTRRVAIAYTTAPDAPALQWLEPVQTAGCAHPFLFTQGHAIHTRSWIPIQDSPGIRVTYQARITVPAPLVAVMGAERVEVAPPAAGVFAFSMSEPIPAYLIALAVGDLAVRELGPRTAVFAEPVLLDRAAHELAEVERMIDAAEALVGPYRWGRFDVLVMPPSFPYGGMENPRLTFASPTLIVGDRSLTTVIVHELAHAWAGNLVTNATWSDFWINEGTTVYLELRIHEALWGPANAGMLRSSGHRDLVEEVERMGSTSPDTRLRYDMTGRDPAEGVTVIPYLKGAAFFWTLEARVGRQAMDRWLRSWFDRHAFVSVTTDTLLADLSSHLVAGADVAGTFDMVRWVDDPGVMEEASPPPSTLASEVDEAAHAVLDGASPASIEGAAWTPQALRHFLGSILAGRPAGALVDALDQAFHFSASRNAEVLVPWLRIELQVDRPGAIDRVEALLRDVGRLKYLRPLYRDLLSTERGAAAARRIYAEAAPRYHAVVRASLERLLAAGTASP